MRLRVALTLSAALTLAAPAIAHAGPGRYVERLAANTQKARLDSGCLVLRSVDLCGWRVQLAQRSTSRLDADVADCTRWGRVCSYELIGRTRTEPFFCTGTVAYYRRLKRWIADQALDCYGDNDPTWGYTDDGTLFREPS